MGLSGPDENAVVLRRRDGLAETRCCHRSWPLWARNGHAKPGFQEPLTLILGQAPRYLRDARVMIITGGSLVLLGLIGYGLATEGHDTHWLLCYFGGLIGIVGVGTRVVAWMHGRLQICPQCYANMRRGLTTCPHCGFTEELSCA